MKSIFLFLLVVGSLSFQSFAEEKDKSHEEHHPAEAKVTEGKSGMGNGMMNGGMMNGEMMGKMDMGKMKEMMDQCKSMHKDGKMCDENVMKSCQKSMDSKECKEMMKTMKKTMK